MITFHQNTVDDTVEVNNHVCVKSKRIGEYFLICGCGLYYTSITITLLGINIQDSGCLLGYAAF